MTYKTRGVGPIVHAEGYLSVWMPDHPLARADGYVFVHRQVAWDAGLLTDPALEVHHRNEDKADNRLDNLEILTKSEHARRHAWERGQITNQFGTFAVSEHGRAAYVRGCRCPLCTKANTDDCRARRQARR